MWQAHTLLVVFKIGSFIGHSQEGGYPTFDLRMFTDAFHKCFGIFGMIGSGQSPEIL
jgi:hypothetical protein